jgi:hypothetical protein
VKRPSPEPVALSGEDPAVTRPSSTSYRKVGPESTTAGDLISAQRAPEDPGKLHSSPESSSRPSAGERWSKLFGEIVQFIIGAYFFIWMMIASPYFWWQYAHEHGFVATAFLGPFVAGAKGAIWPYFAVSSLLRKDWTKEEKENLEHLIRSQSASAKAGVLMEGIAREEDMTPTDRARILALLQESLDESMLVRDEVLAKIHPDYPKMLREKWAEVVRRGIRLLKQDRPDPEEALQIRRLSEEWRSWLESHEGGFKFPKDDSY